MSYLKLRQKKKFKEEINKGLSQTFDVKISEQMRKIIKQDNNCVIAIIMFYDNRESPVLNVLGIVVFWFIGKYACVDSLSLQR